MSAQIPLPAKALAHPEAARRDAGSDLQSYWALGYVIAHDPGVKQMPINHLMKLQRRLRDGLSTTCASSATSASSWAIPTSDGILLSDAIDNGLKLGIRHFF